jgi:DNA-binding LacI/PurR family transcriptional regulator
MHRTTANDVAAAVEVDPSTVSRVLHGNSPRHRYDPRTVRRIREAARRLGYRPSGTARALRTGKTTLIGLVVADIASPFFAELAGRVERHLGASGYRLVVCNTDEQPQRQGALIAELMSHPMEGLIVAPSGTEGLAEALAAGVALVTIDRPSRIKGIGHVGLDDELAGRMIGAHLTQLGYRQAGVILPDSPDDPGIGWRLMGLKQGLGIGGQILWTVPGPRTSFSPDTSDAVCRRIREQKPDVLVGLNLASNLMALEAVSRLELEVPQQIGVTGIDDFPAAAFWRPPVTVAAQPIEQIADEAVKMLLDRIARPGETEARTQLLPPVMMERGSLRKL